MTYKILFSSLIIVITLISCKKEKASEEIKEETPVPVACDSISFTNDIMPILANYNCGANGCHSTSSAQKGIRLTNHTEVSAVNSSQLLGAIKKQNGFTPMPAGGSLTPAETNKIECWINQGKLNN
jgi:hypothetical protein